VGKGRKKKRREKNTKCSIRETGKTERGEVNTIFLVGYTKRPFGLVEGKRPKKKGKGKGEGENP